MKIARFKFGSEVGYGVLDGDEYVRLKGDPLLDGIQPLYQRIPAGDVKLLSPVIPRSKVIGIGRNYVDHVKEMGWSSDEDPAMFIKPNTSVIGPGDDIVIPKGVPHVDPEGELAVVIGKVAKNITREQVPDVIFGYTICNDVTSRALQLTDGQWTRAKSYDTFCPLGPVIETELDPASLGIHTELDGKQLQLGSTKDMRMDVPTLVEFVSSVCTLLPGDVISTGSPKGLGTLTNGTTVSVSIEGIGTLTNPVVEK